jgi:hypothetical protein
MTASRHLAVQNSIDTTPYDQGLALVSEKHIRQAERSSYARDDDRSKAQRRINWLSIQVA